MVKKILSILVFLLLSASLLLFMRNAKICLHYYPKISYGDALWYKAYLLSQDIYAFIIALVAVAVSLMCIMVETQGSWLLRCVGALASLYFGISSSDIFDRYHKIYYFVPGDKVILILSVLLALYHLVPQKNEPGRK